MKLLLDGGLGTYLKNAYDTDLWSAEVLINDPTLLRKAHLAYAESGADILTTCTYQLTMRIYDHGYSKKDLKIFFQRAIDLATVSNRQTAFSIGPYAAYLGDESEYTGIYKASFNDLILYHKKTIELIKDLPNFNVDFIAFETIPNFSEFKAVFSLLNELPPVKTWISMTCVIKQDIPQLRDGTPLRIIKEWLKDNLKDSKGPDYIGINCVDPDDLLQCLKCFSGFKLVAYPNSGELYKNKRWTGEKTLLNESLIKDILKHVDIFGGCCRVHPEDILKIGNLMK